MSPYIGAIILSPQDFGYVFLYMQFSSTKLTELKVLSTYKGVSWYAASTNPYPAGSESD